MYKPGETGYIRYLSHVSQPIGLEVVPLYNEFHTTEKSNLQVLDTNFSFFNTSLLTNN